MIEDVKNIIIELEDLTEDSVIYSFYNKNDKNDKGFITINFNTLNKSVDYNNSLTEDLINKIYQKILWYKKIDNFFVKGVIY